MVKRLVEAQGVRTLIMVAVTATLGLLVVACGPSGPSGSSSASQAQAELGSPSAAPSAPQAATAQELADAHAYCKANVASDPSGEQTCVDAYIKALHGQ